MLTVIAQVPAGAMAEHVLLTKLKGLFSAPRLSVIAALPSLRKVQLCCGAVLPAVTLPSVSALLLVSAAIEPAAAPVPDTENVLVLYEAEAIEIALPEYT